MSKRFLWMCLAVLIISNIYFVNVVLQKAFTSFDFSELLLGKILNQGTHWLIIMYLIIKRFWEFKNPKISLLIGIFLLDILNETAFFFSPDDTTAVIIDSIFVGLQRIGWLYIFYLMSGRLLSANRNNNLVNSLVATLICSVYLLFFKDVVESHRVINVMLFLGLLWALSTTGINTKNNVLHSISYGVLLIVIGDIVFIYAEFHDNFNWRYLYTIPKFLINVGELIIVYKILRKYQYITQVL